MRLYSAPLSLFARKVEIALAEKGLAFERVMVPFSQTAGYSPKHPDVLSANPKGQVPVLVDGGLTLFDSTVILEYLEDRYPTPPLYPGTAEGRARCRLDELMADELLLIPVRALMFRTEPPRADPARCAAQEAGAAEAEAVIARNNADLDRRLLGREYLHDTFSAADIAVFMIVHYAARLGAPTAATQHALAAWYARLRARPAFAAIVAEIAAADRELSYLVETRQQDR